MRLILASASPRRSELLRAAGFTFSTLAVDVDEQVLPGETPQACVARLASAKASAADALTTDREAAIIAADTLVAVDEHILGKPTDDDHAAAMLRLLSGRSHIVVTGVCLRHEGRETVHVEVTRVVFAPLSTAEVAFYVQTREGRDKAGAYAIQGVASRYVERIEGSYSNVVGLPVSAVYKLVRSLASRRGSELF